MLLEYIHSISCFFLPLVSFMKTKIKISPTKEKAPQAMKTYPTRLLCVPSSVMDLTRYGMVPEMITTMAQFMAEAKEVALSCIISDMYNQVMGPDVNSNTIMKRTSITRDGYY